MSQNKRKQSPYADRTNSLGYLLRTSFRSISRALENRTSTLGVTASQWHFLRVLWVADGISQRELADRVHMREPTVVIAVKRLEKAGLIYRQKSSEDGRRIDVFLTDRARQLEDELMPMVEEVNDLATQGMTEVEKQELRRLLRKLNDNLGPGYPPTTSAV